MVQEAFERSVDEFSTPLVPPKTFSFSEVLMQLLISRPREVRRLEGHDRARALEALLKKFVAPHVVALESSTDSVWDSNRKMMLIDRLTEYSRGLTMRAAITNDVKATEAASKRRQQLRDEILMLIKELESQDKPATANRRRFSCFSAR